MHALRPANKKCTCLTGAEADLKQMTKNTSSKHFCPLSSTHDACADRRVHNHHIHHMVDSHHSLRTIHRRALALPCCALTAWPRGPHSRHSHHSWAWHRS